jgi:4-hydroxy-3-polyprenylbenzoate decarboxylase
VVLAVCPDPLLLMAGGFKGPWGVSELDWAGGIAGRPIEVTRGVVTDLPIPAHAEIALEGFIEPGASCDEGPFVEWTGYVAGEYKKEGGFPLLVNVRSILHADHPLLLGVRPMKPPAHWYTAAPIANAPGIWNQLEDGGQRGVRGVWTHVLESFGAIWTVVAIDQLYPGHAKEVGLAAAVCPSSNGWGAFVIVVDADVDITNLQEVLWTIAMRCRLDRDVTRIDGIRSSSLFPWVTPDERRSGSVTGSRMIFDACKEFHRKDDYPTVGVFDATYRARIAQRFRL